MKFDTLEQVFQYVATHLMTAERLKSVANEFGFSTPEVLTNG